MNISINTAHNELINIQFANKIITAVALININNAGYRMFLLLIN